MRTLAALTAVALAVTRISKSAAGQSWRELLDQATSLHAAQNIDSAEVIGRPALREAKDAFGSEDSSVAFVLSKLAVYHWDQAKYAEAEATWKRCFAIIDEVFHRRHRPAPTIMRSLAVVCQIQGRYSEAERLYLHAVE